MEISVNTGLIQKYNLTPTQALIYAYISTLAKMVESDVILVMSKDISTMFDLTMKTVAKNIEPLIEKELIKVLANTGRGFKYQVLSHG